MIAARKSWSLWVAAPVSLVALALTWGSLARAEVSAISTLERWLMRGAVEASVAAVHLADDVLMWNERRAGRPLENVPAARI